MNEEIIKSLSGELNLKEKQVREALTLLSEGATIPFIARYRKERTGGLNEEALRKINEEYMYEVNLLKRKEDVIRLIDEKGLLTLELKNSILSAGKLSEVEDLYRPFKEKKKTKATLAIKEGLEPLAKKIMTFPNKTKEELASPFLTDKFKTVDEVIENAGYIISEWVSDNAYYRKWIRNFTYNTGVIVTKKKKNEKDEEKIYEMYYDYEERVKYIKPHRVLAITRAEKEDVISYNIKVDEDKVLSFLESKIIKRDFPLKKELQEFIKDAYKRLIAPSIQREIKSEIFDKAEDAAILVFGENLENLLMTPPLKEMRVLGFDPAFRTGCKLAVLNKLGEVLDISVIYPHEPVNKYEEAKKILKDLINKYDIDIIAIGNGTASRESEAFIAETLKEVEKNVKYISVSEAGASVYSASKLAKEEFPTLTASERSAISIGRRVQDPLSELVKIDPKSIGVGEYQHDLKPKNLNERLSFVISKVVNNIGVNINTASSSILSYISGLTKTSISKIIDYRNKNGKIKTREEIKNIKGISEKTYEQSIGFLRVLNGDNILDKTNIHPESYEKTKELLNYLNVSEDLIGTDEIKEILSNINKSDIIDKLGIDKYTLEDIILSLTKVIVDPREDIKTPILRSDILKIEDLKVGDEVEGTVRNVVDFGAFIDIGIKNDALVHISKITNEYIKHPSEVLKVGEIVKAKIINVDLDKKKVSLSLI